ncbi:MAG: 1-acyl-sn-glycerol-3-phosphate acyltransferase [Thermoanaerobaculia bacterium]|jgi:1-acyl-sn-glycerol-3-phosphate acyltransferase|nr:1-acyl-sn-glycerol-3-phosphate acyltransferase [Thermoanaerobaculia bacterium]
MLRTIWTIIVAVAVTIPCASAVLIIAMLSSASPWIEPIIRLWARLIVWGAGIDLRTEGTEGIDRSKRYILIANHHSYFDIPCIFAAIPQPIRFMAKKSLFSIPIFGWAIGRAGFIPIDRKNRRTAVKSFDLAVERIRRGNTIVIFPEEGRSREVAMRPFQRGAFLLAIRSELPILPIAIEGTYEVHRVGAKRITPGPVTIRVGTEIETAGVGVRAKESLSVQSRGQIEAMLAGENHSTTETQRAQS